MEAWKNQGNLDRLWYHYTQTTYAPQTLTYLFSMTRRGTPFHFSTLQRMEGVFRQPSSSILLGFQFSGIGSNLGYIRDRPAEIAAFNMLLGQSLLH